MKSVIIWQIACMIYEKILRKLLKDAVNDPAVEWDDLILRIVDNIFEYEE